MRVIPRKFHEKGNVTGVKRKFVERERERNEFPREFHAISGSYDTKISLAECEESVEKPVNDEMVYDERKRSSERETRRRCGATRGVVN